MMMSIDVELVLLFVDLFDFLDRDFVLFVEAICLWSSDYMYIRNNRVVSGNNRLDNRRLVKTRLQKIEIYKINLL